MKKLLFIMLIISSLFAVEKTYKITQFYGVNQTGFPIYKSWKTNDFSYYGDSMTTVYFKDINTKNK